MSSEIAQLMLLIVVVVAMIVIMNLYNRLQTAKAVAKGREATHLSYQNKLFSQIESMSTSNMEYLEKMDSLLQRIHQLQGEVESWKAKSVT